MEDEVIKRADCQACLDFYVRGIPTYKHDLELGCAPDCPCQHEHEEDLACSCNDREFCGECGRRR